MNIYLNSIVIAACEVLAYMVTGKKIKNILKNILDLFIPKIRRKTITFWGLAIAAVLSFSFLFLTTDPDNEFST